MLKQHSDYKGLNAKKIWRKHMKNESCKWNFGTKEQKAMFLVVSQSDVHFDFAHRKKFDYYMPLNLRILSSSSTSPSLLDTPPAIRDRRAGLLRKLWCLIERSPLFATHKTFVRRHFDFSDIKYKQAYNLSLHQKIKSVQYNACLAITRAISGTSKEMVYNESRVLSNLLLV